MAILTLGGLFRLLSALDVVSPDADNKRWEWPARSASSRLWRHYNLTVGPGLAVSRRWLVWRGPPCACLSGCLDLRSLQEQ
jgi:hypothetical protein